MANFSGQHITRCSRNIIDNSSFNVWQRGNSFTVRGYTADRWIVGSDGAVQWTAAVSGDVPTGVQSIYSEKVTITTPDTSITGDDHLHLKQHVEGYNFLPLVGKVGVVSFWVKSTLVGTYNFYVRNPTDRSYVTEYTINQASTWEYKTIIIPFDYSGGTWNTLNGTGLMVGWPLGMGPTYVTGTKDQWVTGNYMGTSGQADFMGSTHSFYLTEVQLETGSVASPHQGLNPKNEMSVCERYYEKDFVYHNAVSAATATGYVYSTWAYKTVKRTGAPVAAYSVLGDNLDVYTPGFGWTPLTALTIFAVTDRMVSYWVRDSVKTWYNIAKGNLLRLNWTITDDVV